MAIDDRFTGPGGARVLEEAFLAAPLVSSNAVVAKELAGASTVIRYPAGAEIIKQGGPDRDVFLVLVGSVSVESNGRAGPIRTAGQHFGEMALIDVRAKRSATIRALEELAVARISEPEFTRIAEVHGFLWRNLAIELGDRLRQRTAGVPHKNAQPRVFIGSSVEGLPIAEAIQDGLSHTNAIIQPWSQGVFNAPKGAIEALEDVVAASDIAVLIFSPDDITTSRKKRKAAPRDNVVFELGLFMGALSHKRTFIVRQQGLDIRIPTDLIGITPLEYKAGDPDDLAVLVGPVCTGLKKAIRSLGPK